MITLLMLCRVLYGQLKFTFKLRKNLLWIAAHDKLNMFLNKFWKKLQKSDLSFLLDDPDK